MASNGKKSQLSPAQERAAALLAGGMSARDAAQELGLTEFTLCRWRREPQFIAAINALINAQNEAVIDRLRALVGKAVGAIESLLDDPKVSPTDRLKAAAMALELAGFNASNPPIKFGQRLPTSVTAIDQAEQQAEQEARGREEIASWAEFLVDADIPPLSAG